MGEMPIQDTELIDVEKLTVTPTRGQWEIEGKGSHCCILDSIGSYKYSFAVDSQFDNYDAPI